MHNDSERFTHTHTDTHTDTEKERLRGQGRRKGKHVEQLFHHSGTHRKRMMVIALS